MNLLGLIILTLCLTSVLYWLFAFKLLKKGMVVFACGMVAGILVWSTHWLLGYPVDTVDLLIVTICCGTISSGFVWGPRVRAKLPF